MTPGGQLGSNQGGYDRTAGESQVTQVITEWRLNVSITILYTRSLLTQKSPQINEVPVGITTIPTYVTTDLNFTLSRLCLPLQHH